MKDIVYYYGRRGQDVQSHTATNIRQYGKYIKENIKEMAMHRKMALDALDKKLVYLIIEWKINYRLNKFQLEKNIQVPEFRSSKNRLPINY